MRFLLLFVAAVIAVFAGMAALQLSSKKPDVVPEHAQSVATVNVMVARTSIPAGSVITSAMLDSQPWPENLALKQFIISGTPDADLIGKVARTPFQEREPIIASKLAGTNEAGFLAAGLPAGMRAVTIATDAVSGVAGFIYAGDHVDVVFTHNLTDHGKAAQGNDRPAYSEVLVANAPVLAINLRDPPTRQEGGGNVNPPVVAPSSITLQVSPLQAENLRLAEKVGTLSVALRSLKDLTNQAITEPTNLSGLTHVHLTETPQQEDDTVKVIKR